MDLCLCNGQDPDVLDDSQCSPLYTAIMKNDASSAIIPINAYGSVLHVDCEHGLEDVVSALLTHQANVAVQDMMINPKRLEITQSSRKNNWEVQN